MRALRRRVRAIEIREAYGSADAFWDEFLRQAHRVAGRTEDGEEAFSRVEIVVGLKRRDADYVEGEKRLREMLKEAEIAGWSR